MWSEYGYAYDDDGENRDGDENWYQGRTTSFRANAAYSLYGTTKQDIFSTLALNKCSQHFYINTFITSNGADSLLNVTGRLSSSDDFYSGNGHDTCSAVSNDDDNHDNGRWLESGENDDNDMSTTMGCSLSGYNYAMAVFDGSYCDGKYFLKTTDDMRDYNRQMKKISCDKIYDASSGSNTQDATPAHVLLEESSSCSNYMYDNRCPNPYGVNKAYRRKRIDGQASLRLLSCLALLVGSVLMAAGYYARHRKWIRRRANRVLRKRRSQEEEEEDGETLPTMSTLSRKSSRSSPRWKSKSKRRPSSTTSDGLIMEKKKSKKKPSSRRSKSSRRLEMGEAEV
jgi:hypothetical protein